MFGRLPDLAFLVVLSASPIAAQTQDSSASQTAPAPQTSTAAAPCTRTNRSSEPCPSPKKVWTNEDMAGVKGGVSVVGDKRSENYHMTPAQPADAATVDRIKKSLQKLQTQLDDVNAKLASYKQFQEGEAVSSGERDMSKAYSRTPVDQQMVQLQTKKKDLTNQIGDLLDEARKKGIDSSQLR